MPGGIQEHISEVAAWIVYVNIGAVVLLGIVSPFLVIALKKWIQSLVTNQFCSMSQAKCREAMATSLGDKFETLERSNTEDHGKIYDKITENRENAVKDFTDMRKEIKDGLLNLTNLLIGHIQNNGG